jgi:glycosyltransferase involved in cell wall biosynthesis
MDESGPGGPGARRAGTHVPPAGGERPLCGDRGAANVAGMATMGWGRDNASQSITVIIPTRNRRDYLLQAVASVGRAAERVSESCSVELVVVDDGSTDGTLELSLPGRLVPNHGSGLPAARNTGAEHSSGQLLAFLDDDDVWFEDHLLRHVEAHRRDPAIGVSYSQGRLADDQLRPVTDPYPRPPLPSGWIQEYASQANVQQANTLVVSRPAFEAIGGFNEELIDNEDLDFVERLAERFPFAAVEEVTTLWRQHRRPGPGSLQAWSQRYRRSRLVAAQAMRRDALRRSPRLRLARAVRGRGWAALDAAREAHRCLDHGQRGEAARLLLAAVTVSPPHAVLRVPEFWPAVSRLLRPGPPGTPRRREP